MLPTSAAPPPLLEPLPAGSRLHNPSQPASRGTSHPGCPTQLCLSPPPDVHPSRPSPLTYPPRSGVHLPQCPAPWPGQPARFPRIPRAASTSLPAVPRAATPHPNLRFPAGPPQSRATVARGCSQRALREGSPTSSPFRRSRPGNYNSQRPPRDGGSDVARPHPRLGPAPARRSLRARKSVARVGLREVAPGETLSATRGPGARQSGTVLQARLLNGARVGNSGLQLSPSRSAAKRGHGAGWCGRERAAEGAHGLRAAGGRNGVRQRFRIR